MSLTDGEESHQRKAEHEADERLVGNHFAAKKLQAAVPRQDLRCAYVCEAWRLV